MRYIIIFALFLASGCAAPRVTWVNYIPIGEVKRIDRTHIVGPQESLWQISKIYDVEPWDIAKANGLPIPTELKPGQVLNIPHAAPVRPLIPLYPSRKWQYIILHHTASDTDSALTVDRIHRQERGFENGIGYHFLIDNGSDDRYNGQIEVAPRWLKQMNGAHCKADGMNERGIGICLVGNFNEDKVSRAQGRAMAYLVKKLMKYYHIPKENVLGHNQVKGAATDCPGKKFPWKYLKANI